jgi:hypothetical protein
MPENITEKTWSAINRERGRLIHKNIAGTITVDEKVQLDALQEYADWYIDFTTPRDTRKIDELEKLLAEIKE